MVTTDVASRGIDIDGISTVIHFHIPKDLDTFVHRTGRTGRNGKEGKVYIVGDAEDNKRMNKYSKDLGHLKTLNYLPSEVYQLKDLIDQAKKIESE